MPKTTTDGGASSVWSWDDGTPLEFDDGGVPLPNEGEPVDETSEPVPAESETESADETEPADEPVDEDTRMGSGEPEPVDTIGPAPFGY